MSRCVTMPLCNFHSILSSSRFLLPLPGSLWDLPYYFVPFWAMEDPVLFWAVPPCGRLSMTQPMSKSLFCTHPPSTKFFLATFRCFPSTLPSSSYATRQGTSNFFTSSGHTYLMAFLKSPSKIKVCQCGHLMPRSRPHTSPLLLELSLASTFGLPEPGLTKLIFCSVSHLPIHVPSCCFPDPSFLGSEEGGLAVGRLGN